VVIPTDMCRSVGQNVRVCGDMCIVGLTRKNIRSGSVVAFF